MIKRGGLLLAGCACLVLLSGCAWITNSWLGKAAEYRPNPFKPERIRVVAVMPFFDLTGNKNLKQTNDGYDSVRLGKMFSDELAQCQGFAPIIAPAQVQMQMKKMGLDWVQGDPDGPEKAAKLGRALKADIVIVGAITEFDPYNRPRVGIVLQVFHTGGRAGGGIDLSRLQQTAKPFPVAVGSPGGRWVIASFQQVYDSSRRRIYAKVTEYAEIGITADDRGSSATELVLNDMDRYMRFVAFETIHHFFGVAPKALKK